MLETSIIILTYNSSRFIEKLLESLKDQKDSEIIVVDNASTDDTIKKVKKFEKVKLIETGENLGFAKGINHGSKEAQGKYLLFINPDTAWKSGKIEDLVKVFSQNKNVGVVGGRLVDVNGSAEKSCGRFFGLVESLAVAAGLDEAIGVRFSPKELSKVEFVSGGFMMTDANLFFGIAGFDEKFFMYVEDMEYCYRVKKAGYQVYFTPDVTIEHVGQGSSNREFAVVNIYKGILYFQKKHKNIPERWLVTIALFTKAELIYILGLITNNSYYTSTYGKVLKLF